MSTKEITVGQDYSDVPGGRFIKYGDFSGEHFRDSALVPALRDYDRVVVYLDGTKTYMSSFLEEAFGGLIRERGFTLDDLKKRLVVTSRAPRYAVYVKMVEQNLIAADVEARRTKSETRVA